MENISDALRRLADALEEPADCKKMFSIGNELSDCVENVFSVAVQMYCRTQDERFVKNLKPSKP